MPRSRKRHLSRSRSKTRSRSPSPDKQKKPISNEKDGKRRRLDEIIDSPQQKRSLSFNDEEAASKDLDASNPESTSESQQCDNVKSMNIANEDCVIVEASGSDEKETGDVELGSAKPKYNNCASVSEVETRNTEKATNKASKNQKVISQNDEIVTSDSDTLQMEIIYNKKELLITPKKNLTPKQLQKKIESEKKKQQKQKEKDDREKQRQNEKDKLLAEKHKLKEQKEAERQKLLEEKQKQLELKQKEKEFKEEQKKKEREEKELKRKEKEEQEAQKRKEKEQERLKKLQEIEEKNKEKLKSVALLKKFFKKTEAEEREEKRVNVNSNFKPFEVKSDMRLPPLRRNPLTSNNIDEVDCGLQNQNESVSYLKELKCGKIRPGKSTKTWPYQDPEEEVTVIDDCKVLGETIYEDTSIVHKMKAKFLFFHENRRPAYFGTWRKTSKFVKPRRPFVEDTTHFNYEEDSDDDWEEEEQGESLEISGDEEEKQSENDEDDYEVDNDFFVPHGHLSDDEVDDEENARLSPESLKQKLKLLKDEFEEDIKSKTHKLKPRSIGGIWFNKLNDNVDDAIYRYLQPFAMIVKGPIEIKKRSDIFASPSEKKKVKTYVELPIEQIPFFLKAIHGNVNNKKIVIEEFLTFMANNGWSVDVSKANLTRFLKNSATYKRCKENGPLKNKFGWFVNDDIKEKYNFNLDLPKTES